MSVHAEVLLIAVGATTVPPDVPKETPELIPGAPPPSEGPAPTIADLRLTIVIEDPRTVTIIRDGRQNVIIEDGRVVFIVPDDRDLTPNA